MAALMVYKCPCCGGGIEFDSDSQNMKCPYCDTEFETETLKAYDEELKAEKPDEMAWDTAGNADWNEQDDVAVYVCNSCGGEVVCEQTTAATSCPFCDNPVIMKGRVAGDLRPDLVIPFKLDKEAAKAAMLEHLKGKPLLPKLFKDQHHLDEIRGVYVPFWLFDADADAAIRYKATRVNTWSDSRYIYTRTSFYAVYRAGTLGFDHVPVDGSSKMADDLMESIEPYDMSQAVDFQTAYLSGYLADRYDVDAQQSVERANQRVKVSTEQAFRNTVTGYASVVPENTAVQLQNGKARYALMPVWLLNTTWNGEKYTFAMNGQTGKFVGNLPMDKGAFWKWFFGVAAGVAAVVFGAALLLLT